MKMTRVEINGNENVSFYTTSYTWR